MPVRSEHVHEAPSAPVPPLLLLDPPPLDEEPPPEDVLLAPDEEPELLEDEGVVVEEEQPATTATMAAITPEVRFMLHDWARNQDLSRIFSSTQRSRRHGSHCVYASTSSGISPRPSLRLDREDYRCAASRVLGRSRARRGDVASRRGLRASLPEVARNHRRATRPCRVVLGRRQGAPAVSFSEGAGASSVRNFVAASWTSSLCASRCTARSVEKSGWQP